MDSLALKLILTPALVGMASLAGRRWGSAVSGWLVALPLTSGPIVFFLVLTHGAAFATSVAVGTLAGTLSQAAFCLAYAWLAVRWEWPRTLAVSCIVFAAATAVLQHVVLPLMPLYLTVILALALARHLMPRYAAPASVVLPPPPHWDIPARMGVATAFVLILTGLAPALGPQLTGLLAPFPLYATILAIFAQHLQGPLSAIRVLRGLLLGLVAFATFFLVLAALLTRVGIAASFGAASTAALVLQVGTLWMLRRMAG